MNASGDLTLSPPTSTEIRRISLAGYYAVGSLSVRPDRHRGYNIIKDCSDN